MGITGLLADTGLSAVEIARRCRIGVRSVSRWRRGQAPMAKWSRTAARLSIGLGIPFATIAAAVRETRRTRLHREAEAAAKLESRRVNQAERQFRDEAGIDE